MANPRIVEQSPRIVEYTERILNAGQSMPIPHFEPCGNVSKTHLNLYVCIYSEKCTNGKKFTFHSS